MIGTLVGTLVGSAVGTSVAYVVTSVWAGRRERREEHECWNASILSDITGAVELTEDDRWALDRIETANPDLDTLDYDVPVDDDGEDA
jgi:hypothetical protein